MNERIRELAEQASKEAFPVGSMAWMEKFAELIVQECADIGNNAYSDVGNYTYIGDKIKQHFGVEE
jgi:hypothetical protein